MRTRIWIYNTAGNSPICDRFEEYNKMVDTESESEDDPPEVPYR